MRTRVFYTSGGIHIDRLPSLPAQSLRCAIDGDRVMVMTLSDCPISDLIFDEYAREDESTFTSAADAKAYLDVEFAKATAGDWAALTGKPTSFAPSPHSHPISDVTGLQTALDGKLGTGVSVATPTRGLNTTFTPNASKATLCIYSVKTQVTNPLLIGTSSATVTLLSDTNTTPTTERGRVEATSSVGVTVTIALTTSNTAQLSYLVPAGHKVRLASSTTGTGSASIISQVELTLG